MGRRRVYAIRWMAAMGVAGAGLAGGLLAARAATPTDDGASLGIAGSAATQPAALEPFSGLPEVKAPANADGRSAGIHAGTDGRSLTGARPLGGNVTLAILGDLAPVDAQGDDRLKLAVAQLNVLRPDAVLTVGNLVPGLTRDGHRYVDQVQHTREALDALKMPWYPCAGQTDVVSGTRMPADADDHGGDRRFEALYRQYVGPLYYSLRVGAVHVIVLDSEEGVGAGDSISDAQLRWLRRDLNRTFADMGGAADGGRPQWVVVLLHRPLWRMERPTGAAGGGNWQRVHEMLVDFNRRPMVSFEGIDTQGTETRGPRVAAVFAGAERAYSMEPTRDGIRYYVLGPTAALPKTGETAGEALRQMMLVKFETAADAGAGGNGGGGIHAAILPQERGSAWGSQEGRSILPDDVAAAREREVIDSIAAWGNDVMGVEGAIDGRGDDPARASQVTLRLNNPLADPVDVVARVADETGWEMDSRQVSRHMAAGAKENAEILLRRSGNAHEATAGPPVVEFAVKWTDPRGRGHNLLLKRTVTVTPALQITVGGGAGKSVGLENDDGWKGAAQGKAYAWEANDEDPKKPEPAFEMAADGERLLVRVHVRDAVESYWPVMQLDNRWGGLASDAVSVAWVKGTGTEAIVRRVWVLPFGPKGVELWTNTGVGPKQTKLLRLDPKWGIQAAAKPEADGFVVTLALPRKWVCEETASPIAGVSHKILARALMNISVHDNDETAQTWVKSWARDDAEPAAWGRVELTEPVVPATAPANGK